MSRLERQRDPPRGQHGFTLVELVTVILILGVLAAVALPRFADLQGKAREAKLKGALGAMKAASAMVKASAMTDGVSCGAPALTAVTLQGTLIELNYCYAQALGSLDAGILAAASFDAGDGWVVDSANVGGSTPGSVVQVNLSDATQPQNCAISYASAASSASRPAISATTSGC